MWKSVNFFTKTQQEDSLNYSCSTVNYFGDSSGILYNKATRQNCYGYGMVSNQEICNLIHFDKSTKLLYTVGNQDQIPTLKIWKADFKLIRPIKITFDQKIFPVTQFAVHSITHIAIGLENGVVILMRGDFTKDKTISSKIVYQSNNTSQDDEQIIGLGFRDDGLDVSLYIVTSKQIMIVKTNVGSTTTRITKPLVLDTIQSSTTCITPLDKNQEMVIADDQAVYFYGPDGRGPSFIIEGKKSKITWFKGYLVLVTRESTIKDDVELPPATLLTVYDLKNKYVAFKDDFGKRAFNASVGKAIGEPIKHVVADHHEITVITAQGSTFTLTELDMTKKLEILYSKNMFNLSMNIILQPASLVYNSIKALPLDDLITKTLNDSNNAAKETLMEVCKRYADYLYSKQDYDQSVQQYIRTIGHLQPSYVIRKFLDAQQISNLANYLKALHNLDKANPNHTTLLLNCYAKLNNLDSLNEFIDTSDSFDLETGIMVCRNAGFYNQALGIASKFDQHDWYVKIQIEDLRLFDEAISYLDNLPPELFKSVLSKYGFTLVCNRPVKMIKILLDSLKNGSLTNVSEVIPFFLLKPEYCVVFLNNALEALYGVKLDDPESSKASAKDQEAVRFLVDKILDISLALRQSDQPLPSSLSGTWDQKILDILNHADYDLENALFLVKQYQFEAGSLVLYDKLGLYEQYLEHAEDFGSVLGICTKYGERRPELWIKALEFCAKRCKDNQENEELIQILNQIAIREILTEVQIIQELARFDVSLGSVRTFILERMQGLSSTIESTQKTIFTYEQESTKIEADIKEIQTRPLTFQATKCELCKNGLELPSLHFLCRHSYHAKCLGDMTDECPRSDQVDIRCGPERHLIEEILKSQALNAQKHDQFKEKLNASKDPFSTIIDSFGKNMFRTVA